MVSFWLLTSAICAICVVPTILNSRRPDFELITARNVFVLYCLFQFVLSPLLVYLGDYTSAGSTPLICFTSDFRQAVRGQAYVTLGIFAFQWVYWLYTHRHALRGIRPPGSILRIHPRVSQGLPLVLALTSIISFFYLTQTQGGIAQFLSGIDDFRNNHLNGTFLLYLGLYCMYFAFVIVYHSYLKDRRHGKLAFVLFVLAILIGFLGAYRHLAVETAITAAVMRHYGYKRIALSAKVWLVAVLFACVNMVYVAFRDTRADTSVIVSTFQNRPIVDTLYYEFFFRFNGPEAMARIVDVTDATGYTGAPYIAASLATFWVPRSLWADKPYSATAVANVLFFPESFDDVREGGAAAPTVEGTFYWIAGLPGLLIGMAALGALVAFADGLILRRKDLFGFALYANFFLMAAFISEMVDLHVVRFLMRLMLWAVLFLICGQRLCVREESRTVARHSHGGGSDRPRHRPDRGSSNEEGGWCHESL